MGHCEELTLTIANNQTRWLAAFDPERWSDKLPKAKQSEKMAATALIRLRSIWDTPRRTVQNHRGGPVENGTNPKAGRISTMSGRQQICRPELAQRTASRKELCSITATKLIRQKASKSSPIIPMSAGVIQCQIQTAKSRQADTKRTYNQVHSRSEKTNSVNIL